ncbi:MAG TPA: ribosome recycling factor [Thermodesulfobacteriota bacterium]|nr:ribosome recycling factor [Thermodesulfobacteriota bacterium]
MNEILKDAEQRMSKSLDVFKKELSKIRTGRASPSLVEHIKVDYYGTQTPLGQLATISVPDPRSLVVQPWDTGAISNIERAIMQSDIGINPINDGKVIRLNIPLLTQERRKELVKYVGKMAEEYRIAIRQIRKDINNLVKEVEKETKLPEDQVKKGLAKVQEITDSYIKKINETLEAKEKEVMEF